MSVSFSVSAACPVVIAEIGINHNGSPAMARQLVDAAQAAGADVVKFQSFQGPAVACAQTLSVAHLDASLGVDGTVGDLLQTLSLPYEAQAQLFAYCQARGIAVASTPFSLEDVDFLATQPLAFLKIGSTDVTYPALLARAAQTGLPLVLSTGMATLAEVQAAVDVLEQAHVAQLALLHCVSCYPPQPEALNLRAIQTLQRYFPTHCIGYSDHTVGTWASVAAVALGAQIIEKHVTLDTAMAGPDHGVSADPATLASLVAQVKAAHAAMGQGVKRPSPAEAANIPAFRRSWVARVPIAAGTQLTPALLTAKRPATGLSPTVPIVGRHAAVDIPADVPVVAAMLKA
jgi:sialic acid synthase SpsE